MTKLTKANIHTIDFDKGGGIVPAIIQHKKTQEVLMLGYVNAGSLIETYEQKKVTFYSRSKERLWTKGEISGNFLHFHEAFLDCDQDTILIFATPEGPVCHTGSTTCFDLPESTGIARNNQMPQNFDLGQLEKIVLDRKNNPQEGSYTNQLLNKGINKVAQKVGEEAVELVIESKDENDDLFREEAADLLYHFSVLLAAKNIKLDEVYQVLGKRHGINK